MTTQTRTMTADELLQMPDDGFHYELVRGELRTMPPPGFGHGAIAARFIGRLITYVEAGGLGVVCTSETGFLLATKPDTVLAPDAAFVRQARIDALGWPRGYWPGAPDLVAEVMSPSDSYKEVAEKVANWLAAGTLMVVIIDPRQQVVLVHRPATATLTLAADDQLDGGDVVPGWTLPVRDLFARMQAS